MSLALFSYLYLGLLLAPPYGLQGLRLESYVLLVLAFAELDWVARRSLGYLHYYRDQISFCGLRLFLYTSNPNSIIIICTLSAHIFRSAAISFALTFNPLEI